jgi:AcrR family transcriptional regulator
MNIDLTNFNKISAEKQKTVINAGFLCFGQNGYKKTSVQDIATTAEIAKASLFQYFGSKKGMYLFLYDFAGKEINRRIPEGMDDYFDCAQMYVQTLADVSRDYPNLFDFLILQAQRRDFSEIEELLNTANDVCQTNLDTIYAHVDWNKFQDGFDKEVVTNLFNWITSGCISELSGQMPQEDVYAEMIRYLRLLKPVMYKPDCIG